MISTITLDTYKQQISSGDAFNLSDSFNGRVGDEQVPLVVQFKERGLAQQFQDGLVPFITGFVGSLDENDQVTAETGEAVSYVGTSDDIVGLGRVKMNLPGTMFPQEGYFYGFLGLQNADGKRVTTFNVWFHVYNGNPDMFVNKSPFRTELQKVLDAAQALVNTENSNFGAAMLDWKQQVTSLLTDVNGDVAKVQTTLTLVQSELDKLNTKIQGSDLVTVTDLKTFTTTINQQLTDTLAVNIDESELFGGTVKPADSTILKAMDQALDVNKFNFVFMTDNHFGQLSNFPTKPTNYALQHVANANYFGNVDAVVLGGENTDGSTIPMAALTSDVRQMASKFLYGGLTDADRFALLGNHDDGSLRTDSWVTDGKRYEFPGAITEAQLANYYHTADCTYGEQRVNGSFYFYKDYPAKKIRLIGLNSDDMPEDMLNADGSQTYSRQHHLGYRQAQLDWLANTALANWPDGYTAVILAHVPLDGDGGVDGKTNFNFGALQQILSAFKNGESKSVTGTTPNFEVNVTTNFNQQGPQPIAGLFHGHLHKESYNQVSGINNIGMAASIPGFDPNMADSDAFVIITIDTVAQRIGIKGFGRATDRQFNY